MSKLTRQTSNIIICVAELLIGVLLLIEPVKFTSGIIILFGVIMALMGLSNIVAYFREEAVYAAQEHTLSQGLTFLVAGGFCIIKYQWLLATFPILTVLYGVVTLLTGISKVQWAVDMLRLKQKYWYVALICAAVTLILAVVILWNPFATMTITWIFIGISLIAEAVADCVALVFEKK